MTERRATRPAHQRRNKPMEKTRLTVLLNGVPVGFVEISDDGDLSMSFGTPYMARPLKALADALVREFAEEYGLDPKEIIDDAADERFNQQVAAVKQQHGKRATH